MSLNKNRDFHQDLPNKVRKIKNKQKSEGHAVRHDFIEKYVVSITDENSLILHVGSTTCSYGFEEKNMHYFDVENKKITRLSDRQINNSDNFSYSSTGYDMIVCDENALNNADS